MVPASLSPFFMIGVNRLFKRTTLRLSYQPKIRYYSRRTTTTPPEPIARSQVEKQSAGKMASNLYIDDTPDEVKNAKVLETRCRWPGANS